jgi:hypothetical protein
MASATTLTTTTASFDGALVPAPFRARTRTKYVPGGADTVNVVVAFRVSSATLHSDANPRLGNHQGHRSEPMSRRSGPVPSEQAWTRTHKQAGLGARNSRVRRGPDAATQLKKDPDVNQSGPREASAISAATETAQHQRAPPPNFGRSGPRQRSVDESADRNLRWTGAERSFCRSSLSRTSNDKSQAGTP